jgi:hypothetical protein
MRGLVQQIEVWEICQYMVYVVGKLQDLPIGKVKSLRLTVGDSIGASSGLKE